MEPRLLLDVALHPRFAENRLVYLSYARPGDGGISTDVTKIGEGTSKPGMAQPVHVWIPSIAPSGTAFYTGEKFPKWRGDLFVGALKDRMLVRLRLDGEKVVKEERMLQGVLGRIRDVRSGPDGFLYLLTDESPGALVRLEPLP